MSNVPKGKRGTSCNWFFSVSFHPPAFSRRRQEAEEMVRRWEESMENDELRRAIGRIQFNSKRFRVYSLDCWGLSVSPQYGKFLPSCDIPSALSPNPSPGSIHGPVSCHWHSAFDVTKKGQEETTTTVLPFPLWTPLMCQLPFDSLTLCRGWKEEEDLDL